jgi:hypothetical protein
MLDLESIAVDTELEQNGQYIDIPDWKGVSLGVRSLEIEEYKIAVEQAVEKLARKYDGGMIPPKEREIVIGSLLAKHILFDWKGISPAYSAEFAQEFLGSDRGRHLSNKVLWAARRVGRIDAKFQDDAAKN